jgi:Flp pilus assembly pilin Flp
MASTLKAFCQEEGGQDLVEYSLLLAFIALAAVSILGSVGKGLVNLFKSENTALTGVS